MANTDMQQKILARGAMLRQFRAHDGWKYYARWLSKRYKEVIRRLAEEKDVVELARLAARKEMLEEMASYWQSEILAADSLEKRLASSVVEDEDEY